MLIQYARKTLEGISKGDFYLGFIFSAPIWVIQIILLTPVSVFFLSKYRNDPISLEYYYKRMFEALLDVSITNLFMIIIILFYFFLLVIPGVWKAYQFFFVNLVIVYEFKAGSVALQRSKEIVQNSWWFVFLSHMAVVIPLSFIMVIILHFIKDNFILNSFVEYFSFSFIMILNAGLAGILYGYLSNHHYTE